LLLLYQSTNESRYEVPDGRTSLPLLCYFPWRAAHYQGVAALGIAKAMLYNLLFLYRIPRVSLANTSKATTDQRLLLAIQFACNQAGLRLPFTAAGVLVGPSVTEGAIVQHLAKLRARLLEAGESVPPLLKRGGGYGPAAGPSNSSKSAKAKGKAKVAGKSLKAATESDSDDDEGYEDDNAKDAKGKGKEKARPKGKKPQSKPRSTKAVAIKKESEDEDGSALSAKARGKRPRNVSGDDSEYGQGKKLAKVDSGGFLTIRRGKPGSDDGGEDEDEEMQEDWEEFESEGEDDDDLDTAQKTVAAGAPFLEQDSEHESEYSATWFQPQSQVARLKIGHGREAKKLLQNLGYVDPQEYGSEADEESVSYQEPTKAKEDLGDSGADHHGVVSCNAMGATGVDHGSKQLSMSPVARNDSQYGLGTFGTSGNNSIFANDLGGLQFPNDAAVAGPSNYQAIMTAGTDSYPFSTVYQSPSGNPTNPYAYHGYGLNGFQLGSSSFNGGQNANNFPAGSMGSGQPRIKNESRTGQGHQAFGVPQQANIPTTRDSWLSASNTNVHPTPNDGPIGGFDGYAPGGNSYFDYPAALNTGDSGQDPLTEFTGLDGIDSFMDDYHWTFPEVGGGGL